MHKYNGAEGKGGGDLMVSLNTPQGLDGEKIVEQLDIITETDSIFFEHTDPVKKDLYEQMVKDCTHRLLKTGRIDKLDAYILLHSHGIDEYFPKKTAKEIAEIYKIKNTEVRTRRFVTAKKVAKELQKTEHVEHKQFKITRMSHSINVRMSDNQYKILKDFCTAKNQNIASIWRYLLNQFISSEILQHNFEEISQKEKADKSPPIPKHKYSPNYSNHQSSSQG